jgi:hypothetical protein
VKGACREHLLNDTGDQTSGDGAATLTDVETLTGLGSDGVVGLEDHLNVITGHDTSGEITIGEAEITGLIGSTDVHLGTIVGAEASTATTLSLSQNVHGDQELVAGLGSLGSSNDHTTAEIITLNTTEEETGVVTSTGLVTGLLEGLNVGNLGLNGVTVEGSTNNLDLSILLQETTLDTARDDSATTGNGENFLNRHEERLVQVTLGGRDPSVDSLHELINLLGTDIRAAVLESTEGRAEDDRSLLTLEAVGGEKLTHLKLDELKHLGVLNGIDLVDEHNDLLDTDLAGKQQVLTSLGPVK